MNVAQAIGTGVRKYVTFGGRGRDLGLSALLAVLLGTTPTAAIRYRNPEELEHFLLNDFATDARIAPILNECTSKRLVQYTVRGLRRAAAAMSSKQDAQYLNARANDLDITDADRYICLYDIFLAGGFVPGGWDTSRNPITIMAKLNDMTPIGVQSFQKSLRYAMFYCHEPDFCLNRYDKGAVFGLYCGMRNNTVFWSYSGDDRNRCTDLRLDLN